MATTKAAGGLRDRVFKGWAPQTGVMCLALLDTGKRPFLPVLEHHPGVWGGWLFPAVPDDDISGQLRAGGHGPAARRAPCYCRVALADLSAP